MSVALPIGGTVLRRRESAAAAAATSPARPGISRAYAWLVFALTLGLLLSDYMSRQVLNAVFPLLKAEWGLSDTQLGSLSGIVALMVGLLTIPLSLLADRWGRVNSLTLMAVLWSLATLGCGLAQSYGQMFTARLFVGVGEAAYGSVGIAVILAVFPAHMRATLTGAFTSGGMFGSVLGMGLGGIIATQFGWRWSFWVMAVFGLLLVALYRLLVSDAKVTPPREVTRVDAAHPHSRIVPFRTLLPGLFSSTAVICAYVGSGLQLLVMASLLAWLPSFLNRYYMLAPDRAGIGAAVFVLVSGAGMIVCGYLTDRLSRNQPVRKLVMAIGYCLTTFALLSVAYQLPPGPAQLVVLGFGVFLAAGTTGPAGAMVANLTHASIHATAFATLTLANNMLGLAPGPILTGMMADRWDLLTALQVITFACVASAAAFAVGIRHYETDLARLRDSNGGLRSGAAGSAA